MVLGWPEEVLLGVDDWLEGKPPVGHGSPEGKPPEEEGAGLCDVPLLSFPALPLTRISPLAFSWGCGHSC